MYGWLTFHVNSPTIAAENRKLVDQSYRVKNTILYENQVSGTSLAPFFFCVAPHGLPGGFVNK
jgi:hypothetical protein